MNPMKKLLFLLMPAVLLFSACEKEKLEQRSATPVPPTSAPVTCGDVQTQNLMAGQTIPAGTIAMSNDATNLYVTYTTTGGWEIQHTHLYVGSCSAIPTNDAGNPTVGLFPYNTAHSPRVTSYTYTIPLAGLDSCYCIAAHAEVVLVDGSGNIIQTETGWGQGSPIGGHSWAMVMNYCTQACTEGGGHDCNITAGDYRTQTQGGWGAPPNGGNPASYMQSHFSSAFPYGLVIGCTTGYTITLTNSNAVLDFLPQGGTPAGLTQSYIDPTVLGNVLAGQVAALTLSVGFDNYYADFGAAPGHLSDLVITTGDFAGMTVAQVLAEANKVLGGCSSSYTAAQLNAAVTSINENFDNGTMVGTFLTCP